jgi:hypothetical protein
VIANTQSVLDWSRNYIPDQKNRIKTIRNEELGRTTVATTEREAFYIKHQAVGSVFLYIEPYRYTACPSLGTSSIASLAKVFMYNATLQSCIIAKKADAAMRPGQFKPVLADYEYTEPQMYSYSDTELVEYLPPAIQYLANNYGVSITYTGTGTSLDVGTLTDAEQEIIARGLALLVRRNFVAEQMRRGLGVSFRGPIAAIDSKTQLNAYNSETDRLEESIKIKVDYSALTGGSAQAIDLYGEDVVTS